MARCSGTGLEGVTPSLIGENLANRHSCQPPPAVAVNQHCHFFITSSTKIFENINRWFCFFLCYELGILQRVLQIWDRQLIIWKLRHHYASKSHKRKACSVWVSLHVMRIPLYAKKCEARSAPCLRPGALATPNSRFSQVHATERAEGGGVIWGYFHIFTIFRPDLLRHLEHLHWGRVSHGRGFKPPYRDCSLRINLPTPIFLSLCSTLQLCWCLMKS